MGEFAELVFPGCEKVAELFREPTLGAEALTTLQNCWVEQEELVEKEKAFLSQMARCQIEDKNREFEDLLAAKRKVQEDADELRNQITKLAREKAQMLSQKLQGGQPREKEKRSEEVAVVEELLPQDRRFEDELLEAQRARSAAEAGERSAQDSARAAERRERETQERLDATLEQMRRLHQDMDQIRQEGESLRSQTRQAVEHKNTEVDELRAMVAELQKEVGSNSFIERFAAQQAGRDAEFRQMQKERETLLGTLAEREKLLGLSYSQEKVLKDRIRELEAGHGRGMVANDYLKHVVLKYVEYTQKGDLKARMLIPVISKLLCLTREERKSIDRAALPQPLMVLNQAVGDATIWIRGDETSDFTNVALRPDDVHPAFAAG